MRPPDHIQSRARSLGLEILSWDPQRGAVRRFLPGSEGPTFMGTHAEVLAYLQAWEHLRAERVTEPGVRDSMLAINSGSPIPPGSRACICVRPQAPFRGRRVAIPDRIAAHFVIHDLRVGNISQFPQAQDVPGDTWAVRLQGMPIFELTAEIERREGSEHAIAQFRMINAKAAELGHPLTMTTCQTAIDISVTVSCTDDETSHPFELLILGEELGQYLPPSNPLWGRPSWPREDQPGIAAVDLPPARVIRLDRTPPGFGWDPDPDL